MKNRINIKQEDLRIQKLKQIEQELEENPKGMLYIWGCARTAFAVTDFCNRNSKVSIQGYIVDDAYFKEQEFCEKKVYKASEWKAIAKPGDYVIMGFTGQDRAKRVIQELPEGITGIYFYFPYSANVDGTYMNYQFYSGHEKRFLKVYEMLEDDISRDTMEAFINGCITGDIQKLEALRVQGQYFNELTQKCKVGSFIDCGAYIGDTIEAAVKFYRDRIQKIIAFEPDSSNVSQLRQRVSACGMTEETLQLVTKGTWSKEAVLHFSSSNSSSSISEEGSLEIQVDSIDHALEKITGLVNYIKMDVEGSEKETLLGAVNTIERHHPILAVCVYHKAEDLFVLFETVKELIKENEYQFYLRYYGPDLRELVLYGIPKE
ncbi:MAG: FkbM family methyltransferase [Roseburia sp.]|nr:FkbM family methyltransferase [Roseburia sp.]MCM1278077.1 FkbM family methyltransferase [Robinsoniella sp.]